MSRIIDGWINMWGFAYIVVSFVKPDIYVGIDPITGTVISLFIGLAMLIGLVSVNSKKAGFTEFGRILLFLIGLEETAGGIMSFCGYISWNVPLDPGLASVTMAFMDLIGAAMLFSKAWETKEAK